jgi:hypothetical protein
MMISCSRLFFLLLLLQVETSLAQPVMNEAEKDHARQSKLKEQSAFSLQLNRDIDKRTFLSQKVSFDEQGNTLEQTYYDSTDLEKVKWTNIFSPAHKLTGRIFCEYRDTIAITTIHYSANGFPENEITANTDGVMLIKTVYTCDAKGHIIRATEEIFPESETYIKHAYRYDQQGFLILRFLSESKSHVKHDFKYEYTKSGLLSKVTESGHDTVPFGWISFDYEKNGAFRFFSVKHENGKHFKVYYSYDSHGGLKAESKNLYLNTVLLDQERSEFTLDAKGNIKKRLKYKMNNELSVLYNYTYRYYE